MANFIVRRFLSIPLKGKLYFAIGIMTFLVLFELGTLWFAMHTLSSVRAYVEAEGLWSKSQKDATINLYKYSIDENPEDYKSFLYFLQTQLGDKKARLELIKNAPDYDKAFSGFYQGRVNPKDINGMVQLFDRFRKIYYINRALHFWTKGDSLISELLETGAILHQKITTKSLTAKDQDLLQKRISNLNFQLTSVEDDFSSALGAGSRWLEKVILSILLFTAVFVELSGILLSFSINNSISKGINKIVSVSREVSKGDFSQKIKIRSRDEMGYLADSINTMIHELNQGTKYRKDAEARLSEASSTLQSLINTIPIAIITTDNHLIVRMWNPAAEHIFGYTADEVIGKPYPLIPQEKMDEVMEQEKRMIEERKTINFDTIRSKKDHTPVYVNTSLTPLLNKNNEVIGVIRTLIDNTERHNSEKRIKEREERLAEAQAIAHVGSWEWTILSDKISWSDELFKIYGIKKEEFKGTFKEYLNAIHPDDRELVKASIAETIKTHNPFDYFHRIIRPDGAVRLIHAKGETSFYVKNSSLKMHGTAQDVTDAKKAEEKFRGLLESAPDAMVIVNQEGLIQLVNSQAENLFGYTKEELINKKVEMLIPGRYKEIHPHHRDSFFANPNTRGMGVGLELFGLKKDETEFPVEVSLSPIETEEGLIVSAAIRDITERKKIEKSLSIKATQLAQVNDDLEKIASHDIQEPLRQITSYVQLLQRKHGNELGTEANEFIKYAVEGAQRIQELINDLVKYTNISKENLIIEPLNIQAIIREVLKEAKEIIENKNAEFEFGEIPKIEGDRNQIKLLLVNLINNALKFSHSAPHIVISGTEFKREWEFSIRDNGIGIDPQYKERVFSIFQRLHKRDEYSGTGIGLSICKKIVEKHKGEIWFESKPGEGSVFYFTVSKNLKDEVSVS